MVVVFFFVYVSRGKRRRRTPGPSEVLPPPSELQSDARKNPSGLGKTPSESTRCQHVRISLSRERHFFQPLVFFFLFLCISPVMRMIRTMAQEKKQTKKNHQARPRRQKAGDRGDAPKRQGAPAFTCWRGKHVVAGEEEGREKKRLTTA